MQHRVILTIVFAASLAVTPAAGVPASSHVTCVGDSITYGAGTTNPATKSYPAVLQGLLTSSYNVQNDGHSGATLLHNGDLPYTGTSEYTASTDWAAVGGDVVIQLGTNDTKSQNWVNKASFEADCEALVAHYLSSSPKPRVWVNLTPPAFAGACCGISGTIVHDEVLPLLKQCAANKGVSTIDVYSSLLGQSAHFGDGVHPDDFGAAIIAQTVHDALVKLPTVSLAGAAVSFTLPAPVVVNATPTAAYGKVEQVEIFEGTTSVGKITAEPWTSTLTLAAGTHALHAVVTETGGRTAESSPAISVIVVAASADSGASSSSGSSSSSGVTTTSSSTSSSGSDAATPGAAAPADDSGCSFVRGRALAGSAVGLAAVLGALAWLRRRRPTTRR